MTLTLFRIFFLLLVPAFLSNTSLAQPTEQFIKRDISERLKPASPGKSIKARTFILNADDRNTTFQATSDQPFSVFFGETMIASDVQNLKWDMDSLNQALGFPSQLTFFNNHSSPVRLAQITRMVRDPMEPERRKRNIQMNFAVITGSILLLFLSFIPGVLIEAISGFSKLFSINLRDDRAEELRSNSASAILLVLFTTLTSSILLTFLRSPDLSESEAWFGSWLINFLILSGVVLARYVLLFLFSWIFDSGEVFDHQMNGFFRFVLLLCLLSGSFMLLDFISVGRLSFSVQTLNFLIPGLITIYYLTLFLRLHRSTSFRSLHLFSYLCVSEFIPLVLLVFTF